MIVKKEVDYAKEIGEVVSLSGKLIKTIKEKGDYAAVLPDLILAVEGVSNIDDEFKSNRQAALATVGYHAGELVDALLPKV